MTFKFTVEHGINPSNVAPTKGDSSTMVARSKPPTPIKKLIAKNLAFSRSPHPQPSRHDGSDETPHRRKHRHVSVPGLYGHVHVLGAL